MKIRTLTRSVAVAAALVLAPVAASAAPAGTYTFDPTHTFVVFKVDHTNLAPVYGMFVGASGSFYYDASNPGKMKVELSIKADQVYTGARKRDGHLKGPDFFNAKQFPNIEFKSNSVKMSGDTVTVNGTMTFHGVSKPKILVLKKVAEGNQRGKDTLSFEGEITLDRTEFGITYGEGAIGNDVKLMISVDGVK